MIVPTNPYAATQNPILAANPRPFGPGGYGEFVQARFTAPANPFAGMGEFANARYTAPANPFAGMGEFANARYTAPANPFAGMGEFVQGISYTVPQNPFAMVKAKGMGCGCPVFARGMGQTDTTLVPDPTAVVVTDPTTGIMTTLDQYLASIQSAFSGATSSTGTSSIWTWVAVGFGLYMVYWLVTPGGREYGRKKSDLEDQYRGYRRVGRTAKTVGGAIVPAGLTRTSKRRK